ncbi:MAG: hypothetical protein JKY54_10810, partial [Flavobacteriales bacterium]|nr:hypothetical protein [Flavobacteriales bacterium]
MNSIIFMMLFASIIGKSDKTSLESAINSKLITYSVSSNGNGIKDGILTISLENKSKKSLNLLIPAGAIFKCSDDPRQDQINVDQRVFVLQPNKSVSKNLITMCIESHDSGPGDKIGYRYEKLAKENLLACARYLNSHSIFNSAGQSAIWVFSDQESP